MDVLQFINSKDISAHLKGISYQFTTLQASWLVYQSRNFTLQEKIDAWREIIASMPDCIVKERRNCIQMDSLHDFLREYITLQEKIIRKLEAQNADAVYRYEIRYDTDNSFDGEGNLYSSYDKCLTAVKNEVNDDLDIVEYRISKVWIDQKDKSITAYYNRNSSLMAIDTSIFFSDRECDVECHSFDGMWFDFPTPFKKGDILIDPDNPYRGCCSGPFVAIKINIDPHKDKEMYEREVLDGDATDMLVYGFFQTDDGTIYNECMHQYMDCEYYRGELTGKLRILKAMSNFLKGNISEELLMCAYHQILMQEHAKDSMPNWYTDEGMELAGLINLPKN